jgi:AAA15 family ATPase/GTPase
MRLFSSPATNPQSAQLIFNTHDTNLLSSGDLRRDQIWFTEKDPTGSSHLYPLTDFKPRRQENLENGYLQGRYGAIPFVHPDYLTGSSGGNGEKS